MNILNNIIAGFCNATWDGFLCWPLTPAGETATQTCPENIKGIIKGSKLLFNPRVAPSGTIKYVSLGPPLVAFQGSFSAI